MYKKILVPLDGSELAEVALPAAEKLAGQLGSEITLVYVNESTKRLEKDTDLIPAYLRKIVESVKERDIQVKSVILSGNPAEQIVEYADAENIGLIVMATHGQSGIRRWPLGSIADKVVRATTRTVLLIRARGPRPQVREYVTPHKVLVPLDGSKEGEAIIPYIEEIASRIKLEVILLQVLARGYGFLSYDVDLTAEQMESDEASAAAYLNRVASRLKAKGMAVITAAILSERIEPSNPAEEIIRFADEQQVDVTAMTTHGRSGVGRQVFGSVAERILREGNTPLMLVRSPKAKAEEYK
jgi:nucleotide-binding universal stress UspA family protein